MSSVEAGLYRWAAPLSGGRGALVRVHESELDDSAIVVADSWLITEGNALALGLHRERFLESVRRTDDDERASQLWDAAIAAIPRTGEWFPRVELRANGDLLLRLRPAPARTKSLRATSLRGQDPRTTPLVKGPDLAAMNMLRDQAKAEGADEIVILTPDGYVVEGAYSSIAWWRGAILCAPPIEFDRVDSVTARSLFGIAGALGIEIHREAVTPAELEATEVWALNALHGPRIITAWLHGPQLAELPGRLASWRTRLAALRHPLPTRSVDS